MPAQPVQAPGVATSPYGVLPEPPKVRGWLSAVKSGTSMRTTCRVVDWPPPAWRAFFPCRNALPLPSMPTLPPNRLSPPPPTLPALPQVSPAPEYKVGLTQRPAGLLSGGPPRPAALITPRSITPRSGVRMRPRRSMSATRMSKSPADFLAAAANVAGTPGSAVPGAGAQRAHVEGRSVLAAGHFGGLNTIQLVLGCMLLTFCGLLTHPQPPPPPRQTAAAAPRPTAASLCLGRTRAACLCATPCPQLRGQAPSAPALREPWEAHLAARRCAHLAAAQACASRRDGAATAARQRRLAPTAAAASSWQVRRCSIVKLFCCCCWMVPHQRRCN